MMLLEDRRLLSTLPVTTLEDDGPGSLRTAVEQAVANPDHDTITFDASLTGTIRLTRALPDLLHDVTLIGPGADILNVARQEESGWFRIFAVSLQSTVEISGLKISQGRAEAGGGILNRGTAAHPQRRGQRQSGVR